MGGRGGSSGTSNLGPVGVSSPNGEMKKVTLYHASFSDFEEFDYSKSTKRGSDLMGQGFYFTADPKQARLFGDILYTVEVKYSTDRRTAKKLGESKTFSMMPKLDIGSFLQTKPKTLKLRKRNGLVKYANYPKAKAGYVVSVYKV